MLIYEIIKAKSLYSAKTKARKKPLKGPYAPPPKPLPKPKPLTPTPLQIKQKQQKNIQAYTNAVQRALAHPSNSTHNAPGSSYKSSLQPNEETRSPEEIENFIKHVRGENP